MNIPGLTFRSFGPGDRRFWLNLGPYRPDDEGVPIRPVRLRVEFSTLGRRAALKYARDEDHTIGLGVGWVVWISWDRRGHDWTGREWGVWLWGDLLNLAWAGDDSETHYDGKGGRGRPRAGWVWSCFLGDAILGRLRFERTETARESRTLTLPEGRYVARCVVTHCVWWRARWPWWPLTRTLDRLEVDFDPPVGIPGKGENAWDCDDDATYSLTTPLKHGSIRATLDQFALDTLRTRQRRGGLDWQPREGWPAIVTLGGAPGEG